MINGERLWTRLFELAEISKQEGGGVTRLSFTEEERAAKSLVASYMEEAGLSVYEDAVGNLFGRREGSDPEAPVVLVGSHHCRLSLQRWELRLNPYGRYSFDLDGDTELAQPHLPGTV